LCPRGSPLSSKVPNPFRYPSYRLLVDPGRLFSNPPGAYSVPVCRRFPSRCPRAFIYSDDTWSVARKWRTGKIDGPAVHSPVTWNRATDILEISFANFSLSCSLNRSSVHVRYARFHGHPGSSWPEEISPPPIHLDEPFFFFGGVVAERTCSVKWNVIATEEPTRAPLVLVRASDTVAQTPRETCRLIDRFGTRKTDRRGPSSRRPICDARRAFSGRRINEPKKLGGAF